MPYPVRPVREPACLKGLENGELPDSILVTVKGLAGGPDLRLVEPTARKWIAMCAAALEAGHILQATSTMDSYRPLSVQTRIFKDRYSPSPIKNRPTKRWNGKTYWQKVGTAVAAVPGHSNHGRAVAIDTRTKAAAMGSGEVGKAALAWLLKNEESFGFSHELQSEPWHLHDFAGDDIPPRVLAYEQSISGPSDDERILLEWA